SRRAWRTATACSARLRRRSSITPPSTTIPPSPTRSASPSTTLVSASTGGRRTDRAWRRGDLMRLFVTGAAGFIGTNYVRHVLANHPEDRKSTRLNSSHVAISYAVFCLKKKKKEKTHTLTIMYTMY